MTGTVATVPWGSIAAPVFVLLVAVGFIVAIRWFGDFENSSEAVGSDLNLTTFGFAVDLLADLMQGHPILPKWPLPLPTLVPVILLFFLNLLFYMFNLKLSKVIGLHMAAHHRLQASALKGVSVFLGVLSAIMFIVAQALWS